MTIKEEKDYLNKIISECKKHLGSFPNGDLQFRKIRGCSRFYLKHDEQVQYLGKQDEKLIQALAQKDYEETVLKVAERELKLVCKISKAWKPECIRNVYSKLRKERLDLVKPFDIDDETFVKNWESKKYPGNPHEFTGSALLTMKGEKVRSKSEVLIANTLFHLNIPYRYEYPFMDRTGTLTYPDFTILDVRTRTEKIVEHFGMMENSDYRDKAFKKISFYSESGYYLGDKLIAFFEDFKNPVNSVEVKGVFEAMKKDKPL